MFHVCGTQRVPLHHRSATQRQHSLLAQHIDAVQAAAQLLDRIRSISLLPVGPQMVHRTVNPKAKGTTATAMLATHQPAAHFS